MTAHRMFRAAMVSDVVAARARPASTISATRSQLKRGALFPTQKIRRRARLYGRGLARFEQIEISALCGRSATRSSVAADRSTGAWKRAACADYGERPAAGGEAKSEAADAFAFRAGASANITPTMRISRVSSPGSARLFPPRSRSTRPPTIPISRCRFCASSSPRSCALARRRFPSRSRPAIGDGQSVGPLQAERGEKTSPRCAMARSRSRIRRPASSSRCWTEPARETIWRANWPREPA